MIRLTSLLALSLSLAACAGNGRPEYMRAGTGGEMAYARGERAQRDGDRAAAMLAYRCAAAFGRGYEVAWHDLGVLALDTAEAPETPADAADAFRAEGFTALETAANAGWAASQAELAIRHHRAGNVAEAARWSAIYRTNNRDQALGLTRLPQATSDAIAAAASEAERAAAIEAAADFFPRSLERAEPGPECRDLVSPMRREREIGLEDVIRPDIGAGRPNG